ncbi:hypothetical protein [Roseivivax sediminis]|nr:hypothetical protein [Roseivivax sediminis]
MGLTLGAGLISEDAHTRFRSDLGLTASSVTRTQTLGFSFQSALETEGQGEEETGGLVDPNAQLRYTRRGARSLLEVSASYRKTDVGTVVPEENLDSDELVARVGSRTTYGQGLGLTFGIDTPIEGSIEASRRQIRYSDLGEATLLDFDTTAVAADVQFRASDVLDLRLSGEAERTDTLDGGTDRDSYRLGFGAEYDVSAALSVSLDYGYAWYESREVGAETETAYSPIFDFGLVRQVRDGLYRMDVASRLTNQGTRVDLAVGRERALRLGDLTWSLGVTRSEDGEVDPILGVGYGKELPTSSYEVRLERAVQADAFGDEAFVGALEVGYDRDLGKLSSLGFEMAYREWEFPQDQSDDVERLEVGLEVRRTFARDTDLVSRVSRKRTLTESQGADTETLFFVGVRRNFGWRP